MSRDCNKWCHCREGDFSTGHPPSGITHQPQTLVICCIWRMKCYPVFFMDYVRIMSEAVIRISS